MKTLIMITQLVYSLLISLIVVSCQLDQSTKQPTAVTTADYLVYSAFLNTLTIYREDTANIRVIIYDSTTIRPHDINPATTWSRVTSHLSDRCSYHNDSLLHKKVKEPIWSLLFKALKKPDNQIPRRLQAKLTVRYPIRVCSRRQLRTMSEAGILSDKQYYIFGLSNIIYNTGQTRAIFFSSFNCGGTCGRGELILMEKVGKTWTLVDTFRFWIA